MKVVIAFVGNTLANFVIGLLLAKYLGPEDYGRFALALAVAVMVQTIAFDWTRLAASRFYSERTRIEQPKLRATLDASLALIVLLLSLGTAALLLSGVALPLSRGLVVLAIGTAVANGLFDYQAALMRARFVDGVYARLIIGKNVLSLILTVGGAYWFGSAWMALLGLTLSMVGAMAGVGRNLFDTAARPGLANATLARTLFRYGLPIVLANLLYQSIPLLDRLVIARTQGFAASGQFSFAYDIGLRLVSAIGSMLDVLLFQIAVRADEIHGTERARRQIGNNIGVVVAVLTPACVGCWLVLPSFEVIVAPPEFRGAFSHCLALMLPGLYCYGLIFFALHPLFQIRKRTGPLVAVAGLASLANAAIVTLSPPMLGPAGYAGLLSVALVVGLVLIVAWAVFSRAAWPRTRDLLGTGLATAAMTVTVHLLPDGDLGVARLLGQASVGAGAYGMIAWVFDICGVRHAMRVAIRAKASGGSSF